jgi:NADH:ubiquinone oxidoreductase subunit F (NADH-binding)
MTSLERVLPATDVADLDDHLARYGDALATVRTMSPAAVIEQVADAGLRGRGGAGFPTGTKWATVRDNEAGAAGPVTVVVNGAEGEPGSFKDRTIMRRTPFAVVEGALVAAHAVAATRVVVAVKESFAAERRRLDAAITACRAAGRLGEVTVELFAGPDAYLYGEETALLEAIEGRPPFPRVAPPFRRGIDDVGTPDADAAPDRSAAAVELAGPAATAVGIPTLVDNVETIANLVPLFVHGAAWFRAVGTDRSPGTVVCTVAGDAPGHGVAEFPMGTPLVDVLREVGGVDPDRVAAVAPGVSAAWIRREDLGVPLTYETMAAVGSGLGTAGFVVLDRDRDLLASARDTARFLAVESCGQCTPCKQDGLRLHRALDAALDGATSALADARDALVTVADGARCNLASQQQAAVGGALDWAPADGAGRRDPVIAPIADLVDGRFRLDDTAATKQPDWTHEPVDSGQAPADRLTAAGTPAD